jgi:pyridoxine 4-dehydrogenase
MNTSVLSAVTGGTFTIGGDTTVGRLGYGAMRITGRGIWGSPPDRGEALKVLRRAADLGVDFIDTADSYGPHVSEELICEALHPYQGVTVATKGGLVRTGPGEWYPVGRPEYLRQCVEMSLRRLGVETIDLYQLHRVDPQVPLADQFGALAELRREGKIRHLGLSEVTTQQIEQAERIAPVVSVQNQFNLVNRAHEDVLGYCERHGIAFIPWFPMATGRLASHAGLLASMARRWGSTPAKLALAWLLRRSPAIVAIPGTASVAHLEENVAAAGTELSDEQFQALSRIA